MCSTSQGDREADLVADSQAIASYGSALADAVRSALPMWLADVVHQRCHSNGIDLTGDGELVDRIAQAGALAAADVGDRLYQLLALDIDEQWTNPLSIIRSATRYPTEILRSLDCPPVVRDEFSIRANPDDLYGLSPASFADLGPVVQELGISWGAAKAHIHLKRRKGTGQ